jgi:hypothetical protein
MNREEGVGRGEGVEMARCVAGACPVLCIVHVMLYGTYAPPPRYCGDADSLPNGLIGTGTKRHMCTACVCKGIKRQYKFSIFYL